MNRFSSLVLALALAGALATCPNDCSNNGHCNHYSACECHRNYMGNDCSERVCYFDRAFVDTPQGDLNSNGNLDASGQVKVMTHNRPTDEGYPEAYGQGMGIEVAASDWSEGHFYAECSGKGICQRETGQCACFEGYEGEGCTRVACPSSNDKSCSGHGTCHRLSDLYDDYKAWDATKTQHCICDAGYSGMKCDQRVCPSGDDPVTKYIKYITACGTEPLVTNNARAVDSKISERVYGTLTGASATIAEYQNSQKSSRELIVANHPTSVVYPFCVTLIDEDGLFTVGESIVTSDMEYILNATVIVDRSYDETQPQSNEMQMVRVEYESGGASSLDFALVYTDELGGVYTTRSIACTSDAQCAADVETALEELPHNVAGDVDVVSADCSDAVSTTKVTCEAGGSCSDISFTTEAACTATASGHCSDDSHNIQAACIGSGSCSGGGFMDQATCTTGGTCSDIDAGVCSGGGHTTKAACLGLGTDTPTAFTWTTSQSSCETGACSDGVSADRDTCVAAGSCDDGVQTTETTCLQDAGSCSQAGVCDIPAYTTSGDCTSNSGSWTALDGTSCESNGACSDDQYASQAECEATGSCSDGTSVTFASCNDADGVWAPATWTTFTWTSSNAWTAETWTADSSSPTWTAYTWSANTWSANTWTTNVWGADYNGGDGAALLSIEFIANTGDEKLLTSIGDGQVHASELSKGTTENAICSNRGICDHSTGVCKCFQGFTGGDCGKQNVLAMY